ncbi:MAG: glycosyltransferase [Methylococcales bacterium]
MREHPVLLLCPSLVGAGVERRVYLLINQLAAHWSRLKLGLLREEGEFLSRVDKKQILYVAPTALSQLLCLPFKPCTELYHFLVAIGQIRAMLKTLKPAVVVTFTLETTLPMYVVRLLDSSNNNLWIISEDSNTAVATGKACKIRPVNKILQTLLGYIYQTADFVTTVSSAVQYSVEQIYAIPPEHINVIHNPIDCVAIRQLGNASPPLDFDYILAVGRLVKVKQFDLLIQAFAHTIKSYSIQLVILGEGPELFNLKQLAEQFKLAQLIHFPGFVDNPWVYMKHAKMLVLTSQVEGFGNVIVEAMAVGCPVIATDCGGPNDIIQQSINGLIVSPKPESIVQAIEQFLDDPDFCNQLSSQAQQDIEQYNPEHSAARFDTMLVQLLSTSRLRLP